MMQNSSASDSKESHVQGSDELPDSSSPPASAEDWMALLPGIHHSHPSTSTAGTEFEGLKYWSSDLVDRLSTSMASVYTGSSPTASPSGGLPDAAEQHPTYETAACSGATTFVADLTSLHGDLLQDGSLWSQILLDSASHDNLRARPTSDLNDAQYWRSLRQGGEFLPSDHLQKLEDLPPWDLALRNFTTQSEEMQMSSLGKPDCPSSFQTKLPDDRLSGTTYPQISGIETWRSPQTRCNLSNLHVASMNRLASDTESPREPLIPWHKIKQEYPYSSGVPSLPPSWEQRSNIDRCTFGDTIPQLLDGPLIKSHAAAITSSSVGEDQFPVQRRASPYTSRFPAPFISQSSDGGTTFLSGSLLSTQQLQGIDAAIGEGACAHVLERRLYDLSADATRRCVAVDPQLQYTYLSNIAQPVKPLRNLCLQVDDGRESPTIGSDPKRSIAASLTPAHESSSDGLFKRPRVEQTNPTLPFKQVRKEKLGDRIATLQQLVSPFGKTDTASVLLEAIGYIKFLQEQVQVLSTPYLKGTSTTSTTTIQQDSENCNWSSSGRAQQLDSSEQPKKDLRSRGLCLVPVSCTLQVASDNGADYWSPSLGSGGYG